MVDNTELAALLGSRICHDLISPLGAIGNGVELLTLDGGGRSPEVALIAQSVAQAIARLRFLRIAFGQTGTDHPMGAAEIRAILADWSAEGRVRIVWQPDTPAARHAVRMAFLALLCAEAALPLGGTMTISAAAWRWQCEGQGRRLRIDPAPWSLLTAGPAGPDVPVSPPEVQFALLSCLLHDGPGPARLEVDGPGFRLQWG